MQRTDIKNLAMTTLLLLLAALSLQARTIRIPEDQSSIQGGINAAFHGDTVLVSAGEYHEHLDYLGKRIIVISEEGAGVTSIVGDGTDAVVSFTRWESEEARLIGFTITGGGGRNYAGVRKGGAVYSVDARPNIEENVFLLNCADLGGAVYSDVQAATLEKNTFLHNSALSGGAIYLTNNIYTVSGNAFYENSADRGGAVYISHGTLELESNELYYNEATHGGAVFAEEGRFYSNCSLYKGNLAGENGGAISARSTNVGVNRGFITGNSAGHDGGGLYLSDCTSALLDSTYLSCNTAGRHGGGIYDERTALEIYHSFVRKGRALRGGGCYVLNSCPVLERATFERNNASEYGGAIYASTSGTTARYSTFHNNSAPEGGAFHIYSLHLTLKGCNVTGTREGGAIYGSYITPILSNNNFWNNEGGDYLGLPGGDADIHQDPLYVDSDTGDFRLLNGSPCIDAGPTADTDPDGTRADIGRFPFDQSRDWILYIAPDGYHKAGGEDMAIGWKVINRSNEPVILDIDAFFVLPDEREIHDMSGLVWVEPSWGEPFSGQKTFRYAIPTGAPRGQYTYKALVSGETGDRFHFRID